MANMNTTSPAGMTTSVLIADTVNTTGAGTDSIAQMTKAVNPTSGLTVPVSAALEIQSTQGALLLPRLTSAQLAATSFTPVAGMMAYNSTTGSKVIYSNGSFNSSLLITSVTLTQAQVLGMYAAPVQIIAAPGAGLRIFVFQATLINNFAVAAFATGGVGVLQYAATIHGGGTNALANTIAANFFTAGASTGYTDTDSQAFATNFTGLSNTGIFLSNQTQAFTAGNAASTVAVTVLYYILPAAI